MSADGGQPIRGCRPSYRGMVEEECEEAELVRLANIEVYAKRARAGLPIFEEVIDSRRLHAAVPSEHVG